MPNAADLRLPARVDWDGISWRSADGRAGCSVLSQSVTLVPDASGSASATARFHGFSAPAAVPPLQGVSFRLDVAERSFRPSTDGGLQSLRDSLRSGRPGDDSLSWPAPSFPLSPEEIKP